MATEPYGREIRENRSYRRCLFWIEKKTRGKEYMQKNFFNMNEILIESSSPLRSPLKKIKRRKKQTKANRFCLIPVSH